MVPKLKTLVFSTALLTMGSFSVQAMEEPDSVQPMEESEKDLVYNYCERYDIPTQAVEAIYRHIRGIATAKNEYGVTHLEYEVLFFFYSQARRADEFDMFLEILEKMPIELREEAFKELDGHIGHLGFRPMLDKFQFTSEGILTDSPYKPRDSVKLREIIL